MRLREAIAVATPAAAKAVTVAGLALAASFALLAVVPLRSFREFAFVMTVGRAARHVRGALAARAGADVAVRRGRLVAGPAAGAGLGAAIVERVGDRAGLRDDEALALTEGTLAALGERITDARARRAREAAAAAAGRGGRARADEAERFDVEEFLARAHALRGRRRRRRDAPLRGRGADHAGGGLARRSRLRAGAVVRGLRRSVRRPSTGRFRRDVAPVSDLSHPRF